MNSIIKYFTILLIILPIACKNKDTSISLIQEEDLDLQMIAAYKEGMQELEDGDVILAAKKLNEAEKCFQTTIKLKPDFVEALYNLGNAQKKLGKHSDAVDSYVRAIEKKPDYAQSYINYVFSKIL